MDAVGLRDAIGESKGKLTLLQHFQRTDLIFRSVPDHIWPSTGELDGSHKGRAAAIVGGGPSLTQSFPELRKLHDAGGVVFAPNKSHDWLIDGERDTGGRQHRWLRKPLIPTYGVLVDPSPHISDYMRPHKDVSYLLGTILDYHCFINFLRADSRAYLWVPTFMEDASDILQASERWPDRPMQFVSGGSTVGLRTIGLAVSMGIENIHLHGFDSSYAPGTNTLYAYHKPSITKEQSNPTIVSEGGDQLRFKVNHHMAKQAIEFDDLCKRLDTMIINGIPRSVSLTVHGDGAIPWMAWKSQSPHIHHADPSMMLKKYGTHKYFDYATGLSQSEPLYYSPETPILINQFELPKFSDTKAATK